MFLIEMNHYANGVKDHGITHHIVIKKLWPYLVKKLETNGM